MSLLSSLNLPLCSPILDFALDGIDGQKHSPKDYDSSKVLVLIFTCNHCPYAQAVWPRLIALQDKFKKQHVQFIAINPNFNPDYHEDNFAHMQKYAAEIDLNFPYLLDRDQLVAKKYQAQCTPD